jgi:hypothetical protein
LKLPPLAGWLTQISFVEEQKVQKKPKQKGKRKRALK